MLPLVTFWALVLLACLRAERRRAYGRKPLADWVLDGAGLAVQGAVVPFVQIGIVVAALGVLAPGLSGAVALPGNGLVAGFLLNVVVIDYLYYWNHRLLHSARLWPTHVVHHTVSDMDVLGTSRNTLWSSFLILYWWANGVVAFLLAEPTGFLVGAAVTASLDLWRHSELDLPRGTYPDRIAGAVLVRPRDHAWHHADTDRHGNFGANLSIWDRLHGTYVTGDDRPSRLGVRTRLTLTRKLLWPFA